MKVRLIGGIRHMEISDPLCGAWIEYVAFPMSVTNYEAENPEDPEEITLYDEDELRAWADATFEPEGYQIWDTEIPGGAVLDPEGRDEIRRHELAEALVSLSTAYDDDPKGQVRGALEEARAVVRAVREDKSISPEDCAAAEEKLTALIQNMREARQS